MNSSEYNTNQYQPIEEVLSQNQIYMAEEWLRLHRKYVCNILLTCNKNYPPTESEDKNSPNIWKPEHWRWYLGETQSL